MSNLKLGGLENGLLILLKCQNVFKALGTEFQSIHVPSLICLLAHCSVKARPIGFSYPSTSLI